MALDEDQVHLVGTGRDLLMGAGTRFDVQDSFNPFATQIRTPQSEDRPYAHGALVGAEWLTERVVPIMVIANGASRTVATARAAIQDMSAAFSAVGATGEIAELHFRLNEDPDEFVLFGRPRGIDPDMKNLGLGYAYVSTAFVASDPRIYSGLLTTQSTGLAIQQGGLTIPAEVATTRLRLPGTSGAYSSTPDHASLDITGDLDIRADLDPGVWASGVTRQIVAKWGATSGQWSYTLRVNTTGALQLTWSATGAASLAAASTAVVPELGRRAVRATIDVDNGAAQRVITFYTAPTIAGPWTQLGSPVTQAGATSIFSGPAALAVGSLSDGVSDRLTGSVYAVEVRSGIGGTIAANPDFTARTTGQASFADSTGKTWTVNGDAKIVGSTYRGGLTAPFTVAGVLVGGSLVLTNLGTTDTSLKARIDGPAIEPGLVLSRPDGTVQTLSFDLDLAAGQWLDIDTAARTALLNGLASANQRGVADWDMDPYPIQPGVNTLRFTSADYNDTAQMTAEYRSAWV